MSVNEGMEKLNYGSPKQGAWGKMKVVLCEGTWKNIKESKSQKNMFSFFFGGGKDLNYENITQRACGKEREEGKRGEGERDVRAYAN